MKFPFCAGLLAAAGPAVNGVVAGPDRAVADAVGRLPARLRVVVLLYYYADLPLRDVAAAVRRPEGTVKWMLAEARELLAQTLGDSDE